MDELDGTYSYGYDRLNQLIYEERTGSYAYRYSYVYDPQGNRLQQYRTFGIATSYSYDAGDQLYSAEVFGVTEAVCEFGSVVDPPYDRDVLGLKVALESTASYVVEQADIALVAATGTWDASNYWALALEARDASLTLVSTLATATFDHAGAGLVSLSVPEPSQDVDGRETPELAVSFTKVGDPGPLLAAVGSVRVQREEVG